MAIEARIEFLVHQRVELLIEEKTRELRGRIDELHTELHAVAAKLSALEAKRAPAPVRRTERS